jgi:gamma-glutamylcyclotransferase (GGCT)/AIG2-like uncharacterized protein YtfP
MRSMPGSTRAEPLFVYGTLLEGESNAGLLAGVVRKPATIEGTLWMAPAGYPALVVGSGTSIAGEVVEVDAARLKVLDVLEGVPNLYTRARHEVHTKSGPLSAFVYVISEREARARNYRPLTARDWRHLSR